MIKVRDISDPDEKSNICNNIIRALPEWFGHETAMIRFNKEARTMPFYAAFGNDGAICFVAMKVTQSL